MISGSVVKNIFVATTWWRCSDVSFLLLKLVNCLCNFFSSRFHTRDEVVGVDFLVVLVFT